jgi:hypothetical protein
MPVPILPRATLLLLALSGLSGCGAQAARTSAAAGPALAAHAVEENDHVIVPGRRAGAVALGMSEAALHRLLGRPLERHDSDVQSIQEFAGLTVVLARRTRSVEMVIVPAPHYRTDGGIAVGAAESVVRAALGPPAKQTGSGSTFLTACYANGLVFNYQGRVVENIVVRTPGC